MRTRAVFSGSTGVVPFSTRLTVAIETAALWATSAIVGGRFLRVIFVECGQWESRNMKTLSESAFISIQKTATGVNKLNARTILIRFAHGKPFANTLK